MSSEMKCSNCASPDVAKALMVHSAGTQSGDAVTGFSRGQGQGVGLAFTTTSSSTDFAQRMAPPTVFAWSIVYWILTALAVNFVANKLILSRSSLASELVFLAIGGYVGYLVYQKFRPAELARSRELMANYDRLWVCLRCGNLADRETFEVPVSTLGRSAKK